MTLSEYLIEAVAKRVTGKYKELAMDDIFPGSVLYLKKYEQLPGYPRFKLKNRCPIIGRSKITIWENMQRLLGGPRVVESIYREDHTIVDTDHYVWPIEAFVGF